MTHKYGSKFGALTMGMFYTGRFDLYKNMNTLEELLKVEGVKEITDSTLGQFGEAKEDCTMIEFTNGNNITVRIASCKFRDTEYDLWVINPENGKAMRL